MIEDKAYEIAEERMAKDGHPGPYELYGVFEHGAGSVEHVEGEPDSYDEEGVAEGYRADQNYEVWLESADGYFGKVYISMSWCEDEDGRVDWSSIDWDVSHVMYEVVRE